MGASSEKFVSDLYEKDREWVVNRVRSLSGILHQCECRLEGYVAGVEGVTKVLYDLEAVREGIHAVQTQLAEKHKLPVHQFSPGT